VDLSVNLGEIIKALSQYSGPWAALFVIVVFWHLRYVETQVRERLEDKDKEIERLVAERNKFQDLIVERRKTSKLITRNDYEPE